MRLDESDKLKDVPGKLFPEENIQRLENVQSAVSDSSVRYDPDNDDEAGVHVYILSLGDVTSTFVWTCAKIFKKNTTDRP